MTTQSTSGPAVEAEATHKMAGKYLTFLLGSEEYALPVLRAREIIKVMTITSVPQVPSHVRGVINLRGKVIPVVDLRTRFGFERRADDERTCIIVVEVKTSGGHTLMGIVVDSVSEVLTVTGAEVEETPDFGSRVNTDYLAALAKVKGRVVMLLDLDRVFDLEGIVAQAQLVA